MLFVKTDLFRKIKFVKKCKYVSEGFSKGDRVRKVKASNALPISDDL